jgi:MFS family permease
MVGPLEGFADAWGSSFMNVVYGIAREQANFMISTILTGMCVGCIILPYIADKTDTYHGITLLSAIVMTISFAYLLTVATNSIFVLTAICLIIGIFCAYQVVIISKISTYVEERLSGMAASVANMIIMSFGSVFHNAIGITTDKFWDGTIVNGIKIYNSSAYLKGISVIPLAMIIAIIGFVALIIYEKFKKPTEIETEV